MERVGLKQFMAAAADVVEALYGEVITIAGKVIEAAVSHPSRGGELGLGIDQLDSILKVRIRKALLPTRPIHGKETLTFAGEIWRIDEVTDDRSSDAWYLTCIPAAK